MWARHDWFWIYLWKSGAIFLTNRVVKRNYFLLLNWNPLFKNESNKKSYLCTEKGYDIALSSSPLELFTWRPASRRKFRNHSAWDCSRSAVLNSLSEVQSLMLGGSLEAKKKNSMLTLGRNEHSLTFFTLSPVGSSWVRVKARLASHVIDLEVERKKWQYPSTCIPSCKVGRYLCLVNCKLREKFPCVRWRAQTHCTSKIWSPLPLQLWFCTLVVSVGGLELRWNTAKRIAAIDK